MKPTRLHPRSAARQRGTVLLFALITLTVMLISAVALVRSFGTSQFNAGNLAFKRDLQNQAERAATVVVATLQGGALATPAARANHLVNSNYRANMLWHISSPTIPEALLDDGTFNTVGNAANDIVVADQGVRVRYVVDRLCQTVGLDSTLGADKCTLADNSVSNARDAANLLGAEDASAGGSGAVPQQVVYRLSIRVTGPRNTQAFFQTTFSL